MASSRAAARKQAKRFMALARERRRLNLMKQGKVLIPDSVLRKIAAAGLPPDVVAYNTLLKELQDA
jgi:hypothetical protein